MTKLKNSILNNSFANELTADSEARNFTRQVYDACFSWVKPKETEKPSLIIASKELVEELGISDLYTESFLKIVITNQSVIN